MLKIFVFFKYCKNFVIQEQNFSYKKDLIFIIVSFCCKKNFSSKVVFKI